MCGIMAGGTSNRSPLRGITRGAQDGTSEPSRAEVKSAIVRPRGRPKKRDTFTVSFRIDELRVKELERAAGEFGISVHEYARILVCQALDGTSESQVLEELDGVRGDVRAMRDELLNGVTLLLTNIVAEEHSHDLRAGVERVLRGSGKGA